MIINLGGFSTAMAKTTEIFCFFLFFFISTNEHRDRKLGWNVRFNVFNWFLHYYGFRDYRSMKNNCTFTINKETGDWCINKCKKNASWHTISKRKLHNRFRKDKPFFRQKVDISLPSASDEERLVLLRPVVQFSFTYGVPRGIFFIFV